MATKITKKDMFNQILTNYNLTESEKAFIEHEIELLEKKASNSGKPTKVQIANTAVKADILNGMTAGERYTVTELIKAIPTIGEYTNQKISALLKQLVEQENPPVVKTTEKGKTYFALAE